MVKIGNQIWLGVVLICASYCVYSVHYATMKWLDVAYSIWQLLFVRSALMLVITLTLRPTAGLEVINSPYKVPTAIRALLQVASTYCFFKAASLMDLGEVATLYATAPMIIVVLAVPLLGESVGGLRWVAVVVGMVGTAVAAAPTGALSLEATLYGLGSGFLWALVVLFTRKSGARESTSAQLVTTAVVICLVSALFMQWKTPGSAVEVALMVLLGVEIYLAQMLFFEAYRFAPASLLGPLEYSSVIWSCILGLIVFGELPTGQTMIGTGLIIGAGMVLAMSERHAARRKMRTAST